MRVRDDQKGSPTKGPARRGDGRRVALYVVLALAVGLLALVRWASSREPGITYSEAPLETRGVWTTSDPRYAGRALDVTALTVTLLLGDDGAVPGQLTIARELVDNNQRVLRLEYEGPAGPDALDMVLNPDGTMYLLNQPDIVWAVGEGRPPVAPVVTVVEASRPESPDSNGSGLTLVLLLVAVAGAVGLVTVRHVSVDRAPGVASAVGVPDFVRGVWTTMDQRLEGRSVRIGSGYGFAQFGPGDIRVGGEIAAVKQSRENGSRVVHIQYQTEEGLKDVEMIVDRAGHMRLGEGSKSIWVRRED